MGKQKQGRSRRLRNTEFIRLVRALRRKPKIQLWRKLKERKTPRIPQELGAEMVWYDTDHLLVTETCYKLLTRHRKEFEAWMKIQNHR
jgi:hypothetical protein